MRSSFRSWLPLAFLASVVAIATFAKFDRANASAPPCRFIVVDGGPGNSTVQDTVTHLTWQQTPASATYSWAQAGPYCSQSSYGGQSGWRLPTMKELLSIVDFSEQNPAIDPTAFPGTPNQPFWTGVAGGNGSWPWYVDFADGYVASADPSSTSVLVRCNE